MAIMSSKQSMLNEQMCLDIDGIGHPYTIRCNVLYSLTIGQCRNIK